MHESKAIQISWITIHYTLTHAKTWKNGVCGIFWDGATVNSFEIWRQKAYKTKPLLIIIFDLKWSCNKSFWWFFIKQEQIGLNIPLGGLQIKTYSVVWGRKQLPLIYVMPMAYKEAHRQWVQQRLRDIAFATHPSLTPPLRPFSAFACVCESRRLLQVCPKTMEFAD